MRKGRRSYHDKKDKIIGASTILFGLFAALVLNCGAAEWCYGQPRPLWKIIGTAFELSTIFTGFLLLRSTRIFIRDLNRKELDKLHPPSLSQISRP